MGLGNGNFRCADVRICRCADFFCHADGSHNNLENAERSFVPQDDKRGGVQTVPFCIVLESLMPCRLILS